MLCYNVVSFRYFSSSSSRNKITQEQSHLYFLPYNVWKALIGLILSDISAVSRGVGPGTGTYLRFGQTAKDNGSGFFDLVRKLLLPYCNNITPPYVYSWKDERTQKLYTSLSFNTLTLPCFNFLHWLFYDTKVKTIRNCIIDLICPIVLAF